MINEKHVSLSIRKQSDLLAINRSNLYYKHEGFFDDSTLANEIHDIWLDAPYYGYRRITATLQRRLRKINHKRVLRIMRAIGIQALYPRPRTSLPDKAHKKYPYLLRDLVIDRSNQVWKTDITYIKAIDSWMYLVAIIDVYSRYIIEWRLSNTMDASFCLDMLQCALLKCKPEILNTDQGSQFTSDDWIQCVENNGIKVSMDGVGRWADNIYVERFWRTIKHEHLLWLTFDSVRDLKKSIGEFIHKYNTQRIHQNLGYNTPIEVYSGYTRVPSVCMKKKAKPTSKALTLWVAPLTPPTGGLCSLRREGASNRLGNPK
jgi:putative transposase